MKKILFLGAVDKTGILLNFIKVLSLAGLKCLYIDGTTNENLSVAVPTIDTNMKVVEFDGFDCALKQAHLKNYDMDGYDYIHVDVDNTSFIEGISLEYFDRVYIFTTQDRTAVKRTKQLVNDLLSTREVKTYPMSVIINNFVSTQMDEDYIYNFVDNPFILRSDVAHVFNFDEVDYQRLVENGHDERVNLRKFSRNYRNSLLGLLKDCELAEIKRLSPAMKKARRG